MSKLHDEFVAEIGTSESVDDNVHSMMHAIADRIDACKANRVKLSDLATILREDPVAVSAAVQKVVEFKPTPAQIAADKAAAAEAERKHQANTQPAHTQPLQPGI